MSEHALPTTLRPGTPVDDRTEVIDALLRFATGQELADEVPFRSAFATDATLDFVHPARRLGVEIDRFKGREHIVGSVMSAVARLDTTHTVTNARVLLDRDTASMTALVEAAHFDKADHRRWLVLKNIYRVRVVRAGHRWEMAEVHIHNVWMQGEPSVLIGS